jgi:hypothetical protein
MPIINSIFLPVQVNNESRAVFWDITRRRVVIVYRRFGTKYRSHHPSVIGLLIIEDETDALS